MFYCIWESMVCCECLRIVRQPYRHCRLLIADCRFRDTGAELTLRMDSLVELLQTDLEPELNEQSTIGILQSEMSRLIRSRAPHNASLVNPARPGTEQR